MKLVRKQVGNLKDELDDKKIVFILFLHVDNTHIFLLCSGGLLFLKSSVGGVVLFKGSVFTGYNRTLFLILIFTVSVSFL